MQLKQVMISLMTDNPEILTRAAETFARTASGLAMEDLQVVVMFNNIDEEGNIQTLPGMKQEGDDNG